MPALQFLDLSANLDLIDEMPETMVNLDQVEVFYYDLTGLCPPTSPSFAAWLDTRDQVSRNACYSDLKVRACIPGKYFIQGIAAPNRYDAFLDWRESGLTPGSYQFMLALPEVLPASYDQWVPATYDFGSELNYSLTGAANTLSVQALKNGDNALIDELDTPLVGLYIPSFLAGLDSRLIGSCNSAAIHAQLEYLKEVQYPEQPFTGEITVWEKFPVLGGKKFGLTETQFEANMVFRPSGSGRVRVGGQTGFTAAGHPFQSKVSGHGDLQISEGTGVELTGAYAKLQVDTTVEGEEKLFDLICNAVTSGTCPLKAAEDLPKIGEAIKWLNNKAMVKASFHPLLSGDATFKSQNGALTWQNNTIHSEAELKAIVRVDMIEDEVYASIEGAGKPYVTFQFPPAPDYVQNYGFDLSAGLNVKAYELEQSFSADYAWPGNNAPDGSLAGERRLTASSGWQPSPRNYGPDASQYARFEAGRLQSDRVNDLQSGATVTQTLVSNTNPEARPSLALNGDEMLLVWVHDDISKLKMQSNEIDYARYDPATASWQAPAAITNDLLLDFAPQVAYDAAGKAVAVWLRNKNQQSDATQLDSAYTQAFEIVYAVWDGAAWSAVTTLTNNSAMDHSLSLVRGNDGALMAFWRQNAAGEMLGDATNPDQLFYSLWNGASFGAPQAASGSLAGLLDYAAARYDANTMGIVYSLDGDGDLSTLADQELFQIDWNGGAWTAPSQLTTNGQSDSDPAFFYSAAGDPLLFWMQDDVLNALLGNLAGTPRAVLQENSIAMADFRVVQDASGNLAFFWIGPSDQGMDVFYAVYEADYDLFGQPTQLTHSRGMEQMLAPQIDSGQDLAMAYAQTVINPVDGVQPLLGQTDLVLLRHTFGPDLAPDPHSFSIDDPFPDAGQVVTMSVALQNLGGRSVLDPQLAFYLGDPAQGGSLIDEQTLPMRLTGGMTATVQVNWTVPSNWGPFELYIVSDPAGAVLETDEANNQLIQQIGLAPPGTFKVTKFEDTNDGSCDAADCSLREAVIAANASLDTPLQILLEQGVYQLSLPGSQEDAGATGDLDIALNDTSLTITGAGPDQTFIDAGPLADSPDRVFDLHSSTVTFSGLTIRGGNIAGNGLGLYVGGGINLQASTVIISDTLLTGNTASFGGGIAVGDHSQITLQNSVVRDNSASFAITTADGGYGGGIVSWASAGASDLTSVTLIDSTIEGNYGVWGGGGLYFEGDLHLQDSLVTNNQGANGGGLYGNWVREVSIVDSAVRENTASSANIFLGNGGGLYLPSPDADGQISLENIQVISNTATANGGGIYTDARGATTLLNATIQGNTALNGGGLFGAGQVTFYDSRIDYNTANASGGGLFGSHRLVHSTVTGNSAAGFGGGIDGGGVLTETLVAGNSAGASGGGISVLKDITINSSALLANTAQDAGGGLYVQTAYRDAVTFEGKPRVEILNSTISDNQSGQGGGVDDSGGFSTSGRFASVMFIRSSTISHNQGGGLFHEQFQGWESGYDLTMVLENTIVSNNAGGDCGGDIWDPYFISEGHNLSGDATCTNFSEPGDLTNTDPLLGPLQDNGGPTETRALAKDSPAVDAANDSTCPATDQRLYSRPNGLGCDIGAYEYIPEGSVLWVNPPALTFETSLDAGVYTQTIGIGNPEDKLASWTANEQIPWLTLGSTSGSSMPALLDVKVDNRGLSDGTYTGQVVISSPGLGNSPQAVNVTLIVGAVSNRMYLPLVTR